MRVHCPTLTLYSTAVFSPCHFGISGRYSFNSEGVLANMPSQVRRDTHAVYLRKLVHVCTTRLINLHDKSAHYVLCSISVWLSITIFLTTLKTLSVSALTGKQNHNFNYFMCKHVCMCTHSAHHNYIHCNMLSNFIFQKLLIIITLLNNKR